MAVYKAEMKHDASTITRLMITRYNTFQFSRKLIRFVIALALIIYGLYADPSMITPLICLIIGCVMIGNINYAPRSLARQLVRQMNGQFPHSRYRFSDSGFRYHEQEDEVAYRQLMRLVEDKQYLYLYVNENSGYMVDKATVTGGGAGELKAMLAEKTGLKWTRPSTLLTFNLRSLFSREKSKDKPINDLLKR